MDNYNDNILMEKVPIEMKIQEMTPRERNEYSEGDVVLLTNWISKTNIKKPYFKREKSKKN